MRGYYRVLQAQSGGAWRRRSTKALARVIQEVLRRPGLTEAERPAFLRIAAIRGHRSERARRAQTTQCCLAALRRKIRLERLPAKHDGQAEPALRRPRCESPIRPSISEERFEDRRVVGRRSPSSIQRHPGCQRSHARGRHCCRPGGHRASEGCSQTRPGYARP